MNTPAPTPGAPSPIDPADVALPPTQPIDITAIVSAQLGR
ncbi:hypothetical protein GCM10025866_26470 [Naasia aerilata]|uniref:Uncharacterized protein n=1 Tax=Naasia aerilata TaxID=1162966 RepID=A0ABM8GEI8_9MICO|nr:hypothetical protein GCM10025866_26470 [Naasia aerilata]